MDELINKIYKEQQLNRLIVDFVETENNELKEELKILIIQLIDELQLIK